MTKWRYLGLMAVFALVIAACGPSDGGTTTTSAGGAAGSGGRFLALQWQGPSIVNPYLSSGSKDVMAGSLVLEPLASNGPEGDIVPRLATEIPTVANGGVSEDLRTITWNFQPGVKWSDGTDLTAADAVFTWEYCTSEGAGCSFSANFSGVSGMEAVDDTTLRITFDEPTPNPYLPFVSAQSPILQQAQFADCTGAAAAGCTEANQFPIGTGPYRVTEFRSEDTVLYEMNPEYRGIPDGKPFFGTVEIKGGGDAAGAARSVLEVGDADYAWNLQVAPTVIAEMEARNIGTVHVGFAANVEHINLNQTDPRSDNPSVYDNGNNPHPLFHNNPEFARALSLAIDRAALVEIGYGTTGQIACNVWMAPPAVSTANEWCQTPDVDEANAILDRLGYVDTNNDGIREAEGFGEIVLTYHTSTNSVRQDFQTLVGEAWESIGIGTIMSDVDAGVFFDGTGASPQSYVPFLYDIEMYTYVPLPDPQAHFVGYTLAEMTDSTNNFAGANIPRYFNADFEAKYAELAQTGDLDERIRLSIELNDIMIADGVVIPLVYRGSVSAFKNDIQGVGTLNGWDSEYWNIEEWRRG